MGPVRLHQTVESPSERAPGSCSPSPKICLKNTICRKRHWGKAQRKEHASDDPVNQAYPSSTGEHHPPLSSTPDSLQMYISVGSIVFCKIHLDALVIEMVVKLSVSVGEHVVPDIRIVMRQPWHETERRP